MALSLTKPTSSGVEASYWKITDFKPMGTHLRYQLSGFYNQQTRLEGKNPLAILEFNFPSIPEVEGYRTEGYKQIKLIPEWSESQDC